MREGCWTTLPTMDGATVGKERPSMTANTPADKESIGTTQVDEVLSNVSDENPLKQIVIDLLDRVERVELARDAAHSRIDELEAQLGGNNPKGSGKEDAPAQDDSTPLEQIADDEKDDPVGVQITSSVTRAAEVMKNWSSWSKKAPKGRTVKDNLKNLIETATGESLAWRQVYRACKKVEQLTKGKIVFSKTKRHGWILMQPERSSSVGGT